MRVLFAADRCAMTRPATPGDAQRARPRVGHRLALLGQSRRAAADRLVRPHRFDRDVALDRSGHAHVRGLPVESRASRRQGRRHAVARACGHHRRPRAFPTATSSGGGAARGATSASRPSPSRRAAGAPVQTGIDVLAGRRLRAPEGQAGRPGDEPHGPRRAMARPRSMSCVAPGTSRWSRSSAPSTASAAFVDEDVASSRDERTGLPIHSLYGKTRRPTAEMLEGRRRDGDRPAGRRRPLLHLHARRWRT